VTEKEQFLFMMEVLGIPTSPSGNGAVHMPTICTFIFDPVTGAFVKTIGVGSKLELYRIGTRLTQPNRDSANDTAGRVYFTQKELGALSITGMSNRPEFMVVQGSQHHTQVWMPTDPIGYLVKCLNSVSARTRISVTGRVPGWTKASIANKLAHTHSLAFDESGNYNNLLIIEKGDLLSMLAVGIGAGSYKAKSASNRNVPFITSEVFASWINTI
jgi:hypothetical protein